MDNTKTHTVLQEEESYPYSAIIPKDTIWNLSVQGSTLFQDPMRYQLSESASGSFDFDDSHEFFFQIVPDKTKIHHQDQLFAITAAIDDPFVLDRDNILKLLDIDETYGYNPLQEFDSIQNNTQSLATSYEVNPEFLSGSQPKETFGTAFEIAGGPHDHSRTNSTFSLHFADKFFLENQDTDNDEILDDKEEKMNSFYANGGNDTETWDVANYRSNGFGNSLSNGLTYGLSNEYVTGKETNGIDFKSLMNDSAIAECGTHLSDEPYHYSEHPTPDIFHTASDTITLKGQGLDQSRFLQDVEASALNSTHHYDENPVQSHQSYMGLQNSQAVTKFRPTQSARTKSNWSHLHNLRATGEMMKSSDYGAAPSSPSRRKKKRIEPKRIPSRFKVAPGFNITLQNSVVKCLDVTLDYHGYIGVITDVILNNSITNHYRNHKIDSRVRPREMKEPIYLKYELADGERIESDWGSDNTKRMRSEIHCHMGVVQRKIYIRDISEILNLVSHIKYHKSPNFNINNPYEPQYTRFETDASGIENNETKCGLCAYCKEVRFLPFKNSSYLSHMTLGHGIFADNFIVPEGINFGKYIVPRDKENEPDKTKEINGLQCPTCLEIIEMSCWSTKENPLLKYFRHYKKEHVKDDKKRHNVNSTVNPLEFKSSRDAR